MSLLPKNSENVASFSEFLCPPRLLGTIYSPATACYPSVETHLCKLSVFFPFRLPKASVARGEVLSDQVRRA